MKKINKLLISLTLTASLALSGILAACTDPEKPDDPCTEHVDANGDGVCDNYGTGRGQYFVDADGDGICDNYGTGMGRGCGQGQGRYCRR